MAADSIVSIVVPVFDGEAYLRESLESIVSQTHPRLEVIVMDDASTDGSAAIAAEVAHADDRVRVHSQPANVGQFANVNAGIELARGEFVAVYHADDVYEREIVARELSFLETHPDAAAVFTLATFIDADGREFGRLEPPPEIESRDLLDWPLVLNTVLRHSSGFLATPSAFVRREVYAQVGPFSTEYGIRGDADMWLRIAQRYPVGLIREHLLRYRVGDHNESRRYAHARSDLDPSFTVVDRFLADGGRRVAAPAALDAYETHRAADLLVAAGNAYVLGRRPRARALLGDVRFSRLLASRQRWRLLVLLGSLHVLARLPHSAAVARFLRRRWHAPPGGGR